MTEWKRDETIGTARMILGDCMDLMAGLEDKAFELAIVDPPYGIGETWKKHRQGEAFVDGTYKNEQPPLDLYFIELNRVSQDQIIWGANYFSFIWPVKSLIVWDKECTWDKDRKSEAEIASSSVSCNPTLIYRHAWGGARKAGETGIKIIHPHQKPVALYKWLLSRYAKPGDRILDTHGGSGSSAIACIDLGYQITWIEKDEDYYDAAVKRVKEFASQLRLIDVPVATYKDASLFERP